MNGQRRDRQREVQVRDQAEPVRPRVRRRTRGRQVGERGDAPAPADPARRAPTSGCTTSTPPRSDQVARLGSAAHHLARGDPQRRPPRAGARSRRRRRSAAAPPASTRRAARAPARTAIAVATSQRGATVAGHPPALVRVDQQLDAGADRVAHRLDDLDVLAPVRRGGSGSSPRARRRRAARRRAATRSSGATTLAARRVRQDPLRAPAQQPPQRLAERAPDQIPDRHLDGPRAPAVEVDRLADARARPRSGAGRRPTSSRSSSSASGRCVAARVARRAVVGAHDHERRLAAGRAARDPTRRGTADRARRVAPDSIAAIRTASVPGVVRVRAPVSRRSASAQDRPRDRRRQRVGDRGRAWPRGSARLTAVSSCAAGSTQTPRADDDLVRLARRRARPSATASSTPCAIPSCAAPHVIRPSASARRSWTCCTTTVTGRTTMPGPTHARNGTCPGAAGRAPPTTAAAVGEPRRASTRLMWLPFGDLARPGLADPAVDVALEVVRHAELAFQLEHRADGRAVAHQLETHPATASSGSRCEIEPVERQPPVAGRARGSPGSRARAATEPYSAPDHAALHARDRQRRQRRGPRRRAGSRSAPRRRAAASRGTRPASPPAARSPRSRSRRRRRWPRAIALGGLLGAVRQRPRRVAPSCCASSSLASRDVHRDDRRRARPRRRPARPRARRRRSRTPRRGRRAGRAPSATRRPTPVETAQPTSAATANGTSSGIGTQQRRRHDGALGERREERVVVAAATRRGTGGTSRP